MGVRLLLHVHKSLKTSPLLDHGSCTFRLRGWQKVKTLCMHCMYSVAPSLVGTWL